MVAVIRIRIPFVYATFISITSARCHLGGVAVSVLATAPKGCGLERCQGDGFLKAIKIRSTPSFRMGSKVGGLMP
jgi:hypothetical protein